MQAIAEIKRTWLDRAIGYFNPVAGFKRTQARIAEMEFRRYEGAKKGRRTDGWQALSHSANGEILPDIVTLRNRSRDLVRNNPWIKRSINSWVANSVGEGITCEVKNNERIKKLWIDWAGSIQAMVNKIDQQSRSQMPKR